MRIELMGTPRVLLPDGSRLGGGVLDRRQTRLAFAALVLEREHLLRPDELAEIVWGAELPPTWPVALRGAVSRVRQVLSAAGFGPSCVRTIAGTYRLALPAEVSVDLEAAAAQVALAETVDARTAVPAARAALEVLTRPFLAGVDGAWVERWRLHVRDLRIRAHSALALGLQAVGSPGAAVAAAREAVTLDPLQETAHRQLITLLAESGDRSGALRAYEQCRRLLAEELGASPSPATETVYLDLLGAAPGVGAMTGQLPFTGRDRELALLAAAWTQARAGRPQLLLLDGAAGIGKSRLVREFAERARAAGARVLVGRYEHDVPAVDLALAEALADEVTGSGTERVRRLGEEAAPLAALWPGLTEYVPRISRPAGEDGPHRWALNRAVRRWLSGLPDDRTLLILEDVQWAPARALRSLRGLLAWSADAAARLLVVATFRPDQLVRDERLAEAVADLYGRDGVVRMNVGGLSEAAVRHIFEQKFGRQERSAPFGDLVQEVAARSNGSPLIIAEVIEQLVSAGVLDVDSGGNWQISRDAAPDRRPARLTVAY